MKIKNLAIAAFLAGAVVMSATPIAVAAPARSCNGISYATICLTVVKYEDGYGLTANYSVSFRGHFEFYALGPTGRTYDHNTSDIDHEALQDTAVFAPTSLAGQYICAIAWEQTLGTYAGSPAACEPAA